MKKALIFAPFVVLLITAIAVLRPVPIPDNSSECLQVSAEVITLNETGGKDIVFLIEGSDTRFYINRGTEMGLTVKNLYEKTEGQKVTFFYPKYWTPLDPNSKTRHLSKIQLANGEVLFSEIKNEI